MSKEIISYKGQEWYEALLEELQAIATESVWNSRLELLRGKWLIGQTICQSEGYLKQQGKKGSFIQTISKDINRSQSDIYFCVQFYEKYVFDDFSKALEKLPEGKNCSWNKMVNHYLSDKEGEPKDSRKYISAFVDIETNTIWLKEKYKDFEIKFI